MSYGIQPLGYSPASQHVLYRVSEEQKAETPPAQSPPEGGLGGLAAREELDKAQGDDEVSSARSHSTVGVPVPWGGVWSCWELWETLGHGLWRDTGEAQPGAAERQPENAESVFEAHFLFQPLSAAAQSPKYLTVYVVLDKALVSPCQLLFPCLGLTPVSVEMATFPTFHRDLFSALKRYASCGFCRKEGT